MGVVDVNTEEPGLPTHTLRHELVGHLSAPRCLVQICGNALTVGGKFT